MPCFGSASETHLREDGNGASAAECIQTRCKSLFFTFSAEFMAALLLRTRRCRVSSQRVLHEGERKSTATRTFPDIFMLPFDLRHGVPAVSAVCDVTKGSCCMWSWDQEDKENLSLAHSEETLLKCEVLQNVCCFT